jgi:hypothetical protein
VLHESTRLYEASQETLDKTDAENCSDLLRVHLLRGRSLIERDHLANFQRATQPGLASTGKTNRMRMKIIQVKPARGGWKVFEIPRVEPVFVGTDSKRQAIDYAKTRQGFGQGEIRVLNKAGEVVKSIQFDDKNKAL